MDNGQGSTNMQALQAHQRPMGVQQAYTQFPHSYSPQTPHSAQSPGALQWHAQPHPPAPSYQATQQSLYQQRNIPYQSQLQSAPPTPWAGPHNGPTTQQQASPTTSQYGPIMHASGSASAPPLSLSQDDQCALSESHAFNNEETQLSIEIPDDDEEEDLNSLDVPDLPQAIRLFGQAILKPVSRPLPANFIVADAIYPMAPPPPEADGRCFSKYSEDLNEARSLEEMRNLACWKDRQGDTIFQEILSNDNITLLDDCLNKVRGSQKILTDDDVHRKSRSESRSVAPRSAEAAEMAESLETLERALAEAKAKQAEMIRNRQKAKLRRHSENRQPVDEQIGDSDTKVEQQSPSNLAMPGYSDQRSPSEATPKTFTSGPSPPIGNPRNIQSSPVSMALRPGRRPSSENGSKIHNPDSSALQANGPSWRAPQFHQSPRVPPPPPPAPLDLPQNGPMQSPNSSGGEHHGFVTNGSAYCQYGNHPQSGSPTQYRSDGASAHKRTYDQAAESSSSEDDDDSPRRQEDDVMPKHKRRQPKVAEAYR
ncbi:uncharacterized protein KY384_007764 [Bacidia gigantensis]|uniref:uncharacterized protein n=1 Tax=Bacidia gigantensis TaxID=2732470 RepID=UPI001D037A4B|nr:uncharacterized protein KY384_007764 [Bacidia gigantensis]KAG8527611.1 hypothetical protein KY384_007764 [Bacidia gigantensis]